MQPRPLGSSCLELQEALPGQVQSSSRWHLPPQAVGVRTAYLLSLTGNQMESPS